VIEFKIQVDYLKETLIGRQEGNFTTSKVKHILIIWETKDLLLNYSLLNTKMYFIP